MISFGQFEQKVIASIDKEIGIVFPLSGYSIPYWLSECISMNDKNAILLPSHFQEVIKLQSISELINHNSMILYAKTKP